MTRQEILDLVKDHAEDRITNFQLDKWLGVEINRTINRRPYWWRRKTFKITSVVGTSQYNLSDVADGLNNNPLDVAKDFQQMVKLYHMESVNTFNELTYESEMLSVLAMIYDTTQDEPAKWMIQPGTVHHRTIRLSPVPNAVRDYVGLYLAGANLRLDITEQDIPLIPPDFHDVVLFRMLRRIFFYLYGQKDPRYMGAVAELQEVQGELDAFGDPSIELLKSFAPKDALATVRSTS